MLSDVMFRKISPCCAPRPHCRTVAADPAGARSWIAGVHREGKGERGGGGAQTAWAFRFHGDAPHAPPPRFWSCAGVSGPQPRSEVRRTFAGEPAATPSTVTVAIGPERRRRAGQTRRAAGGPPNNIACRRIPTPRQTLALPGPSDRLHRHLSSIRCSGRQFEPQADISLNSYQPTAPIAQTVRVTFFLSTAARARPRPGCSSAMSAPGAWSISC